MRRLLLLLLVTTLPVWGQAAEPDPNLTGKSMPKVVGLSITEAEQVMAEVTRNYEVVRIPAAQAPGIVFRQSPSHGGSLRKDQPAVLFVTAPLPKEKVNVQVDRQLSDQSQPPGSSRARRYLNLLVLQLAVVLAARYLYSEAEPKEGESSSLRIDLLELRS